jgi:hypothetical protein
VERQEEAGGGRTHAGEQLAERSVAPPSPRSVVTSNQGNVIRGGGRAHPSSDNSAAAGAEAEAEHALGYART